jgi:hypothetical protein
MDDHPNLLMKLEKSISLGLELGAVDGVRLPSFGDDVEFLPH